MSDTPETDSGSFSTVFQGELVKADFARRLERERDELRSDLEFRRGLFQLQEKQLNEVRRERDEWKEKYIQQNKDLRCEMMDPNGTIWDHAKKLQDKFDAQELELFALNSQLSEATEEIEELQEQLNAYIMLDKMAMRKFMRELEEERQGQCRQ